MCVVPACLVPALCSLWACSSLGYQLPGYEASFDLRDPGAYTLQVIIGAFFGVTEPLNKYDLRV